MRRMKLGGKTVLMVIPHTQFREEEFFEPKKTLEDEGAKVVVASTTVRMCRGMKGGTAQADIAIADAKADDYAGIVLCGGSSVPEFLWNDKKLQELVTAMAGDRHDGREVFNFELPYGFRTAELFQSHAQHALHALRVDLRGSADRMKVNAAVFLACFLSLRSHAAFSDDSFHTEALDDVRL